MCLFHLFEIDVGHVVLVVALVALLLVTCSALLLCTGTGIGTCGLLLRVDVLRGGLPCGIQLLRSGIDTGDVLMICPRDDKHLKEITSNIGLPDYEEFR